MNGFAICPVMMRSTIHEDGSSEGRLNSEVNGARRELSTPRTEEVRPAFRAPLSRGRRGASCQLFFQL
jgi:hypothetical protein